MSAAVEDEEVFSASAYDLAVPRIDDRKATQLDIRFSGSGSLDRTSDDDLEFLEAMRMGREVRLIVTGTIAGEASRLSGKEDEEFAYSCTVRVASVEAGEIA